MQIGTLESLDEPMLLLPSVVLSLTYLCLFGQCPPPPPSLPPPARAPTIPKKKKKKEKDLYRYHYSLRSAYAWWHCLILGVSACLFLIIVFYHLSMVSGVARWTP